MSAATMGRDVDLSVRAWVPVVDLRDRPIERVLDILEAAPGPISGRVVARYAEVSLGKAGRLLHLLADVGAIERAPGEHPTWRSTNVRWVLR